MNHRGWTGPIGQRHSLHLLKQKLCKDNTCTVHVCAPLCPCLCVLIVWAHCAVVAQCLSKLKLSQFSNRAHAARPTLTNANYMQRETHVHALAHMQSKYPFVSQRHTDTRGCVILIFSHCRRCCCCALFSLYPLVYNIAAVVCQHFVFSL